MSETESDTGGEGSFANRLTDDASASSSLSEILLFCFVLVLAIIALVVWVGFCITLHHSFKRYLEEKRRRQRRHMVACALSRATSRATAEIGGDGGRGGGGGAEAAGGIPTLSRSVYVVPYGSDGLHAMLEPMHLSFPPTYDEALRMPVVVTSTTGAAAAAATTASHATAIPTSTTTSPLSSPRRPKNENEDDAENNDQPLGGEEIEEEEEEYGEVEQEDEELRRRRRRRRQYAQQHAPHHHHHHQHQHVHLHRRSSAFDGGRTVTTDSRMPTMMTTAAAGSNMPRRQRTIRRVAPDRAVDSAHFVVLPPSYESAIHSSPHHYHPQVQQQPDDPDCDGNDRRSLTSTTL